MLVLFVSTPSHDVMSLFLYDGFADLLGEENVVLAEDYPYILRFPWGGGGRVLAGRKKPSPVLKDRSREFNLIVLNAVFNRDHDWDWASQLARDCLAPSGVLAYIEGWDGHNEVFPAPPTLPIHRVFRREILPGFAYPYHAVPLTWACPAWWFDEERQNKNYDVTCLCSITSDLRWKVMGKVLQTVTRYNCVVGGGVHFDIYLRCTKESKFVVVPPGGGSDCIRQWEAIGAGAVPIFVGHPPRVRDPWFGEGEVLECGVDDLPSVIDNALSGVCYWTMQKKLEARARAEHTTRARAEKVIRMTGAHE
jgi:hypothetical protein